MSSPAPGLKIPQLPSPALGLPVQNPDQASPEETSSCEWAVTRKEHKLSPLAGFQLKSLLPE